jgi:hypothetical protein
LWLQGVAALVANDGFFAQDAEPPPKPRRSLVKRGALLGATSMFIGLFFIVAGLNGNKAEMAFLLYGIGLILLIGISGYLRRLLTKIFSEEDPSPSRKIAYTLSAAYSAPVADSVLQPVDTSRASQPSNVTEQTTSRLNIV